MKIGRSVRTPQQNRIIVLLLFASLSFVNRPVHYISKEGSGKDEAAADGTFTWATCIMIDGPPVLVSY